MSRNLTVTVQCIAILSSTPSDPTRRALARVARAVLERETQEASSPDELERSLATVARHLLTWMSLLDPRSAWQLTRFPAPPRLPYIDELAETLPA